MRRANAIVTSFSANWPMAAPRSSPPWLASRTANTRRMGAGGGPSGEGDAVIKGRVDAPGAGVAGDAVLAAGAGTEEGAGAIVMVRPLLLKLASKGTDP